MNFENYGLEGEMLEKAKADFESSIEEKVQGLKAKNSELIEREKKAKEASDKLALDIATEQENAKVALAEKEGNIEQYKLAVAERDEKIKSIQFEFQEAENSRIIDNAVKEFSTALVDDPAGRMYMESLFRKGIDIKDGNITTKDVTTNIEDFTASLVSDNANAKYIKAKVGSGADSVGGDGSVSDTPKVNEAAEQAKAKGDGIGHLNAHFKDTFTKGN